MGHFNLPNHKIIFDHSIITAFQLFLHYELVVPPSYQLHLWFCASECFDFIIYFILHFVVSDGGKLFKGFESTASLFITNSLFVKLPKLQCTGVTISDIETTEGDKHEIKLKTESKSITSGSQSIPVSLHDLYLREIDVVQRVRPGNLFDSCQIITP